MRRIFVLSRPSRARWRLAAVGATGLFFVGLSANCATPESGPPAIGGEGDGGGQMFRDAGRREAATTSDSHVDGASPALDAAMSDGASDSTASTCPGPSCAPVSVVQPSGKIGGIIADQSGNIYWTIAGPAGGVFAKPIAGGSPAQLSSSDNDPRGIAVDQVRAYWLDFGSDAVGTVPLLGGLSSYPVPTFDGGVSLNQPTAITVDPLKPGQIYWVDNLSGYVNQMMVGRSGAGGPITRLATGAQPIAVAVDSTSVYWLDFGAAPGSGSVNKVPINGDGGSNIQLATGQTRPWDLAVDGKYVYWTSQTDPGSVQAVPIGGGSPITIAQNQHAPSGIVVDPPSTTPNPQFIYWTNSNDSTVMRAPIPGTVDGGAPGSAPTLIASGQNNPTHMAIDHNSVYWASEGTGAILALAK